MMTFCRFCGEDLVNGQCDCEEFKASLGNKTQNIHREEYESNEEYSQPYFEEYSQFRSEEYSQSHSEEHSKPRSYIKKYFSISKLMTYIRGDSESGEFKGSKDPYEYNIPIVPDCVQPEDDEIVVKQYNIAKLRSRLKFMKAEGRLMVTNRRILFRAGGTSLTGNILQMHQFNLDEIAGVELHKDYKFSLLNFFGFFFLNYLTTLLVMFIFHSADSAAIIAISVIFGIIGIIPTFIIPKRFWLKLFLAMLGNGFLVLGFISSNGNGLMGFLLVLSILNALIYLLIVCFVPNLVIKIKTGAMGAIVIGSQLALFRRKTGADYSGFTEVLPWEDTVLAMNELGTMIDDLQRLGDYAIDKWAK